MRRPGRRPSLAPIKRQAFKLRLAMAELQDFINQLSLQGLTSRKPKGRLFYHSKLGFITQEEDPQ